MVVIDCGSRFDHSARSSTDGKGKRGSIITIIITIIAIAFFFNVRDDKQANEEECIMQYFSKDI
jgi:hypothetical protein